MKLLELVSPKYNMCWLVLLFHLSKLLGLPFSVVIVCCYRSLSIFVQHGSVIFFQL